MMNWLKKLMKLIHTNKILKKKIEDVDKRYLIPTSLLKFMNSLG